jgi:hypothetical protein
MEPRSIGACSPRAFVAETDSTCGGAHEFEAVFVNTNRFAVVPPIPS